MKLREVNEEVFVADEPVVRIGGEEIAFLKRQARTNARKRARICAHRTNDDALHEMLIVISTGSYIHPHRHVGKSESFHIIEGDGDVVIFDENGTVIDLVELGEARSGRNFFYRLAESMFHTLLIRTDFLVVHEVTNGPFDRNRTLLAPFAPSEHEGDAVRDYVSRLSEVVAQYPRP